MDLNDLVLELEKGEPQACIKSCEANWKYKTSGADKDKEWSCFGKFIYVTDISCLSLVLSIKLPNGQLDKICKRLGLNREYQNIWDQTIKGTKHLELNCIFHVHFISTNKWINSEIFLKRLG